MSDLVERLRALVIMDEVRSDNPLGRDAADRIEALEKHKRSQMEDVMNLGAQLGQAWLRIEQLEAALLPAKNTLNAVRILMKNQDRRSHEQQVYEAVQICCEAMEEVFTPSSPPKASD